MLRRRFLLGCDRSGLLSGSGGNTLPKGRVAAVLAEANDAFVDHEDVRFRLGLVHGLLLLATATLEQGTPGQFFGFGGRGEVGLPKIGVLVEKRSAVSVKIGLVADLADDADDGFFVRVEVAEDDFLFGAELIFGDDARAVTAEDHCLCHLGKALAIDVASDQKDRELFGNAAAAARMFVRHRHGSQGKRDLRKG